MVQPIGLTDPLSEQIWSTKTHIQNQQENYFLKKGMATVEKADPSDPFMRMPSVPVVIVEQMGRQPGQQVHLRLNKQLTRDPGGTGGQYTRGDQTMVGNEEELLYMDCSIYVENLKNAVGMTDFDLGQLRTSARFEEDAKSRLNEWLTNFTEEGMVDAMYQGWNINVYTNIAAASSAAHPNTIYAEGKSSRSAVHSDSTAIFDVSEARRMSAWARVKNINPVRGPDGQACYCVLASPQAINDFISETEFRGIASQGAHRGSDNPVMKGYDFEWYDLYLYRYTRTRQATASGTGSNVERIMVLGASSLAVAYGSMPRILPLDDTEYGDRWGRGIRQILGMRRIEYQNAADTDTLNQYSSVWEMYNDREDFE